MIAFLGRSRILPAQEWLSRARTGALSDFDLCLTFDDGLLCQYEVAYPVLNANNITAFWFVYTSPLEGSSVRLEMYRYFRTVSFANTEQFYAAFFDFLDRSRYGSLAQQRLATFKPSEFLRACPFYTDGDRRFRFIRDLVLGPEAYEEVMDAMIEQAGVHLDELAKGLWMDRECLMHLHAEGHIVGLHSYTHPTLMETLDASSQETEYRMNKNCLSRILGSAPISMSHPCNSYNETTLTILRSLGIQLGFRADMEKAKLSELEYPREDHTNILREMKR